METIGDNIVAGIDELEKISKQLLENRVVIDLGDKPDKPSVRGSILDAAKGCVCGHRDDDYGTPEDNFGVIAKLWTAYTGAKIEPEDVAAMMILLKIGRISSGSRSNDNWIDIAGYAACGGEILMNKCRKEVENG